MGDWTPRSAKDFMDIKESLIILKLRRDRVPSMQLYRRKYKELIREHHPDKAGKTKVAQDITRASRIVFDYMLANPSKVPKDTDEEQKKKDDELVKMLVSDLTKNKQSVTIKLEMSEVKAWTKAFKEAGATA